VRVPITQRQNALLVSGDAVSFDQQGGYVLVVDSKDVVERRSIKTGQQIGGMLVVEDGLQAEDWVIIDGLMQAIPGRKVKPVRAQASLPVAAAQAASR